MSMYYLAHHGIREQQWGVRRGPPYPLARTSDGRINTKAQASAKRRYGTIQQVTIADAQKSKISMPFQAIIEARRQKRDYKKSLKKTKRDVRRKEAVVKTMERNAAITARQKMADEKLEKAKQSQHEAIKQYVRDHPREVSKYTDLFTADELEEIVSQIRLDRKVKDVRDEEYRRYQRYADDALAALKTVSAVAETSIAIYNSTASIWNAIGKEKYERKVFAQDNKDAKKAKDYVEPFRPLPRVGGNNNQNGDKTKPNQNNQQDQKKPKK